MVWCEAEDPNFKWKTTKNRMRYEPPEYTLALQCNLNTHATIQMECENFQSNEIFPFCAHFDECLFGFFISQYSYFFCDFHLVLDFSKFSK